jgi:hypothetical protein
MAWMDFSEAVRRTLPVRTIVSVWPVDGRVFPGDREMVREYESASLNSYLTPLSTMPEYLSIGMDSYSG